MLWFIGIASVWSFICLLVVALCVTAGRADRELFEPVPADATVAALPADVGFVVTLAEPALRPVPAARPAGRTPVR